MPKDSSHFQCFIKNNNKQISVLFSQGSAHKASPTIERVMECLKLDIDSCERSFKEWCNDCGFDPDSMKAHKVYLACRRTSKKLKNLLKKDFGIFYKEVEIY